jgi:hypothetical protein
MESSKERTTRGLEILLGFELHPVGHDDGKVKLVTPTCKEMIGLPVV